MGTTARPMMRCALAVLALGFAWWPATSRADPCFQTGPDGERYRTCFDPATRLAVHASTSGFGGDISIRHVVHTADSDVSWRLEHRFLDGEAGPTARHIVAYSARFLRHSDSGHIVWPIGPPRKIYMPFDIGMELEVGRFTRHEDDGSFDIGVVRAAALLELTRSPHVRRRVAIGGVVRWDVDVADRSVERHRVAPFSLALLDLYFESEPGLTVLSIRGEAGSMWRSDGAWDRVATARATLERVVISVNDRPVSLFATGSASTRDGVEGIVGLRLALLSGAR